MGAGLCIVATQTSGTAQEGGSSLEARLHVGEDGSITILTGKVEEGQGPRTELALAAAEELRTSVDRVKVVMADTDVVPNEASQPAVAQLHRPCPRFVAAPLPRANYWLLRLHKNGVSRAIGFV